MKRRVPNIPTTPLLIVIASVVSGCATRRVDLVEAGAVTIEKQATGKVYAISAKPSRRCLFGQSIVFALYLGIRAAEVVRD